ncbi:MAG: prolyl oligopeptidase family serine peptidase [Prevotellaceae bacterium]|jgi:dipeptidyl aminopeptidase/acylaminoacyl peptidase|nr:prolyl oligopeptidase family serine peptidase [Prevotellaceae bacterium]
MKKLFTICSAVFVFCTATFTLSAQDIYQNPPQEIMDLMTATPLPETNFSNNYKMYARLQRSKSMNDLTYIAGPEYRIGGVRLNPVTFAESRLTFSNSIQLGDVTGKIVDVTGLPENPRITNVKWSPKDKYVCFLHHAPQEVELWRIDVTSAKAQKINKYPLNAVFGENTRGGDNVYTFIDDEQILYKSVPEDIGEIPQAPAIPVGPIIQESYGKTKTVRTTPDVLRSWYDEQLFEYFATIQFILFSPQGSVKVGEKAIVRSFNLSPNGNYMLVTTEYKPFSYLQGHSSFPNKLEIWDINGNVIKLLEDNTKEEERPTRGANRDQNREPRKSGYGWRNDLPETLVWTESLTPPPPSRGQAPDDQQDEEKKDEPEQKYVTSVFQLAAPFDGEKVLVIKPEYRVGQITWGNQNFAIYTEASTKDKFRNTLSFTPCDTTKAPQLLFTESTEVDSLGIFPVIGRPYITKNSFGVNVVYVDEKQSYIYLTSAGGGVGGGGQNSRKDKAGDNMHFIDRFDLKTKKATNLWMGQAPYNETIESIVDFKNIKFISLKQSVKDVPNYFLVDPKAKKSQQITFYTDPCPPMRQIQSSMIEYERKDGVRLTAMLYLPAGYDAQKDGKLPVFMYGYPYEYKSVADAQKARPSRYSFIRPNVSSQIYVVTQGYAVLDGFAMPIIAENTKKEPNDNFREQLIMNAEAAINYIDSIGIGDRDRVAVGGHSYGAFMTANLLAHTKLFKAGIARSGAYNRSLTPSGFQNESRTYWKAPQLYFDLSPFSYAHQLKTPILLIHGQMDNNDGTFPIQSERLFHALSGLGGHVRYVQLPNESHGYSAKESQFHVMYEMLQFLDKFVKNSATFAP